MALTDRNHRLLVPVSVSARWKDVDSNIYTYEVAAKTAFDVGRTAKRRLIRTRLLSAKSRDQLGG